MKRKRTRFFRASPRIRYDRFCSWQIAANAPKNSVPQRSRRIVMPPIISVVGKSGSGKTTLVVKLILELKRRGYRVGTVKHAAHGFELDQQGKDSWRHKEAGADTVIVASANRICIEKTGDFTRLDFLGPYVDDLDLVLTEGYKSEDKPKIEIFRTEKHRHPLQLPQSQLVALVTDATAPLYPDVPRFGLDDVAPLAELLEALFLLPARATVHPAPAGPGSNGETFA
jgi:molybdopterin-guanine dinucleotide biosynthesis protein MobB